MSELCVLYNFAPKYREGIFKAIDKRWHTNWIFGKNNTDIKGMDLTCLHRYDILTNKTIFGNWYWQAGAISVVNKPYSTYLILGEPYCISTWLIALRLKLFSKGKRLYFWTHGWYGKEGMITKIIKKIFFKLSDGIFLYGNYAKKLMIKEGFNEKKLFVIHNSLDYERQIKIRQNLVLSNIYKNHFNNDNPVVLFIGRLTRVKRLDMLLESVKILKDNNFDVNVVIVGDGDCGPELKIMAKKLGVENQCWFYGACYDEVTNSELIFNADLCVAPGNVGLTAMHAMVFGTPVISHGDFKWQMPEFEAIIPGGTGDFFERDNVKSLANVIKDWLTSHTDREDVRKSCYNEIDLYWTPEFQIKVLDDNLKV